MKNEKTKKNEMCPCFKGQSEEKKEIEQGMKQCMKGAKWFMLIPGLLIILAFFLGYFLDPSTVRLLWLIITATLSVLGISFFIMMNFWIRGIGRKASY